MATASNVNWTIKGEDGLWKDVSDEANTSLEAAFRSGDATLSVEIDGDDFE